MKLLIALILLVFLGIVSLMIDCDKYQKQSQFWHQKYNEQQHAFIRASTLLKYHDSINNSELIINLSKYQYEYIKREIDKKR